MRSMTTTGTATGIEGSIFRAGADRVAGAARPEGRIRIGVTARAKEARCGVGVLFSGSLSGGLIDAGHGADHGETPGAEV